MQTTYNWGIMGAGIIARKMADALRSTQRATLLRVGSKSPQRAESFARELEVPRYGSYADLLQDPEIDVVYVATTHNFHYENAAAALKHGKHVLIEKPFTVNAAQADRLIALAAEKDLFLMEAIWTRFLPSWKKMREVLQEGLIGKVKYIDLSFGKFAPPQYQARLNDPALAGGATLDMGIYSLSYCCYLLGEIPRSSNSMCTLNSAGVDDFACYQLSFPSGAMAQIATGFNLWMDSRALIYGTEGAVSFHDFSSGDRFTLHSHNGGNEIVTTEDIALEHRENGFAYQVEEVITCLDQGKRESSLISHQETRDIMALMDSIRYSWNLRYEGEK
ncbi:MAG: Gfo/Idh/MocA family protein [Spirochaetota bacterium]